MNIIVKTAAGRYIVRPDTTWERDSEDLYVPEFVGKMSFTPVLFARVSRPGRSVGEEFASRYFDGIGFGVLLYPEDMIDGTGEGFAAASCLDHTSFLPFPIQEIDSLVMEGSCFRLEKDGTVIFAYSEGTREMIEKSIAEATRYIYIRTGDLIAIELDTRKPICTRDESRTTLRTTWRGGESMKFDIIM